MATDYRSAIAGKYVTITVESNDRTITYAVNDSVFTDSSGYFNGSLYVGQDWPNLRSETRIFVSFNQNDSRNFNNIERYYVEGTETEFT